MTLAIFKTPESACDLKASSRKGGRARARIQGMKRERERGIPGDTDPTIRLNRASVIGSLESRSVDPQIQRQSVFRAARAREGEKVRARGRERALGRATERTIVSTRLRLRKHERAGSLLFLFALLPSAFGFARTHPAPLSCAPRRRDRRRHRRFHARAHTDTAHSANYPISIFAPPSPSPSSALPWSPRANRQRTSTVNRATRPDPIRPSPPLPPQCAAESIEDPRCVFSDRSR